MRIEKWKSRDICSKELTLYDQVSVQTMKLSLEGDEGLLYWSVIMRIHLLKSDQKLELLGIRNSHTTREREREKVLRKLHSRVNKFYWHFFRTHLFLFLIPKCNFVSPSSLPTVVWFELPIPFTLLIPLLTLPFFILMFSLSLFHSFIDLSSHFHLFSPSLFVWYLNVTGGRDVTSVNKQLRYWTSIFTLISVILTRAKKQKKNWLGSAASQSPK